MIAREYTLKGEKTFKAVFKKGRKYDFESFRLFSCKRKDDETSKFGFVVSKDVSKIAVHRNRVQRVLSEAVRFEMSFLKKGYDVIFLAKQISTTKSTDELMKEVKSALSRASLYE